MTRLTALAGLAILSAWPALAQVPLPDVGPRSEDAPPTVPVPPAIGRLPERVSGAPGTWDLSRDGTNMRCVMTFSLDSGAAGRRLGFPAGCRRALPITATMAGWLFTEGSVRLVDRNVRPLLIFTRRPDQGSLVAHAESGESYSLVPLDIAAMRPAGPEADSPLSPLPATEASPEAPRPAPATSAAEGTRPQPGLYALDRYRDQDVCRLDLEAGAGVRLAAGCRDSGIEVFAPVSWSFANGRLTLKAKRGHTVSLVPTGDGTWRRDPETGATFILRRLDP